MKIQVHLTALLSVSLALAAASCAPKRDLTEDGVKAVTKFSELMWFNATVADPCFALAASKDDGKLTDDEFRRFADMGRRLPLAARRLREPAFTQGPDFDRLAEELAVRAGAVEAAAAVKDGPRAVAAVLDVKETCRSCHQAFR